MKSKVISFCDKTAEWSLYLLIFCLPFAKAGVSIFAVLALMAWLGKRMTGFRSDGFKGLIPLTPLNRALAVFIIINIISVLFSANIQLSFEAFFTKTLKFALIFFVMVETINTEKRVKRLLSAFFLSASLIGADAAVQFFHGKDFLKGYEFDGRLKASFVSGNGFAGWLVVALPLLLGWQAERRKGNRALSMLLIFLILLMTLCLVLTYSRGGWLGFVIALLLIMIYGFMKFSFRKRILCLSAAAGCLAVFLLLPSSLRSDMDNICKIKYPPNTTLTSHIKSALKIDEGSVLIRFNLWKESLAIIKEHPFWGCGLNTYSSVAPKYKTFDGGGIYSHNSYLQMAAEIGLLGLGAFFWIIFNFFKMSVQYLKNHTNYLMMGTCFGVFGFLIHAFFDTHLYSLQLVFLFWFMLGFATAFIKTESLGSE